MDVAKQLPAELHPGPPIAIEPALMVSGPAPGESGSHDVIELPPSLVLALAKGVDVVIQYFPCRLLILFCPNNIRYCKRVKNKIKIAFVFFRENIYIARAKLNFARVQNIKGLGGRLF